MIRRPPRSTRTDTLFPYTTLFRSAGSTQITAALSSNFVTDGGPGAQTIDLRGLGPNRTLVLLNGRRAGPAGTRGAVSSFDLNVLPLSIVRSEEHTSELQSLMRISYAVFCLKKNNRIQSHPKHS